MTVTDMHGTPITEGVWVFDEDNERVLLVAEVLEDFEEGNEIRGDHHEAADPASCIVVTPHPAECPDWFRDDRDDSWISVVGDGSIAVRLFDDELASHPLLAPRPLRVETYRDVAGEFRWRVVHTSNGETMASGEGYTDARDRDHAIAVLFPDVPIVETEA